MIFWHWFNINYEIFCVGFGVCFSVFSQILYHSHNARVIIVFKIASCEPLR